MNSFNLTKRHSSAKFTKLSPCHTFKLYCIWNYLHIRSKELNAGASSSYYESIGLCI